MRQSLNPIRIYQDGFEWTGRTTRLRLFLVTCVFLLATSPLYMLDQFGHTARLVEVGTWITVSLLVVPYLGHIVRRLNEIRWPVGVVFLVLVPILNVLLLAILFTKPHGQRRLHEMTLFRSLGFLAAVLIAILALSRTLWTPYFAV